MKTRPKLKPKHFFSKQFYPAKCSAFNLQVAEMLLREAADIGVTDMHGNHEIHQVGRDYVHCLGIPFRLVKTGW